MVPARGALAAWCRHRTNSPDRSIHDLIILHPIKYFSSYDDYLSNDIEEVRGGLDAAELGLDELDESVGQNLDHCLRRQLVHGVVLLNVYSFYELE